MKVSSVLNLLPDSYESLERFQFNLENEIYEEGMLDAYEVLAKLRLFEKLIKELTKSPRFKEAVSSELSEGENDFGKFTVNESFRDTWNFAKDETYKALKEKEEKAKADLKLHTAFVSKLSEDKFTDGIYVDEETGEVFQQPERLKSSKIITVTWKKPKQIKDYKEDNHLDNIFNKE